MDYEFTWNIQVINVLYSKKCKMNHIRPRLREAILHSSFNKYINKDNEK